MAPGVSEGVGIVVAMYMARKTGSRCWTGVTMSKLFYYFTSRLAYGQLALF